MIIIYLIMVGIVERLALREFDIMNKQELTEILNNHQEWLKDRSRGKIADLSGADLSGADLSGANLPYVDLSEASLFRVDLSSAYLSSANLSRADLSSADLSDANLSRANLFGAYLSFANLFGANLFVADLSSANLTGAYLSNANLSGADLSGADLSSTKLPSPSEVLLANWGELSDELTQKAMAYDASFHHDPSSFDRWKKTGVCPYSDVKYQRACNFRENSSLWDPSIPAPRGFDLMVEIIREKCANSDWH
jgi:hypothetical protein